jgi:riboflavin-specific deaminase-like protein
MSPPEQPRRTPAREPRSADALKLTRVLPPGGSVSASDFVDALDLEERSRAVPLRPYVVLNMISTVDGRATIGGRSGTLGDHADRVLFHALRARVDAVMAGAGTVRLERYGRIVAGESTRALRRERGLSEEPLACIVSRGLSLPHDTPLLADPASRVVFLTPSGASLDGVRAKVDYIRAEHDGRLDLPRAMAELRERFGARTLLCEGGPHLNSELLLAGLVDELFLSLSPKLAGGEGVTGESLRIIAGAEFADPLELELLSALESDSALFLRYAVDASAPVRG